VVTSDKCSKNLLIIEKNYAHNGSQNGITIHLHWSATYYPSYGVKNISRD